MLTFASSSSTTIVLAALQTAQVVALAAIAVIAAKYAADRRTTAERLHDASTERAIQTATSAADDSADVVIRHEMRSEKSKIGHP